MTARNITAVAASILLMLCSGCATRSMPQPAATVDIYMTEEGFLVITERGSNESVAYRFNIAEIHPEPQKSTP